MYIQVPEDTNNKFTFLTLKKTIHEQIISYNMSIKGALAVLTSKNILIIFHL